MATHGELSAFNPTKEQWTSYIERARYYFIANDVKSDEKKYAILFSGCGPETYQTIRSIVDAETLQKSKFENLVEIISAHYDPKPSFIVQCFKAWDKPNKPEDLHYTSHKPRQQWTAGNLETKPSSTPKCYRCLGKHLASSCKHRTTECLFCKKIGHIAKACRSKKDQEKKLVGTPQQTKKTHHLEETEEESEKRDSSYHLFTLESNGQNPITVQVELNQVPT